MTETLPGAARPDVAAMATGLGIALHTAGLPVGPDRCERLARAVTVMDATSLAELRACALATMVSDPGQMPVFDQVFAALFGGPSPFRNLPPLPTPQTFQRAESDGSPRRPGRPRAIRADCRPGCACPTPSRPPPTETSRWPRARPYAGSPPPPSGCAAVTSPSCPRPSSASWSCSYAR
ncbi:MAG TPA: hypothetical protein VGI96_28540 [Streptosporangiaceae bacterium]